MSAITAQFEAAQIRLWVRTRLWVGSAFAVLLVHVAVAALLLLHLHWQRPILAGSADALDVQIAGPSPRSAAPSAAVPQPQPARPPPQPQLAASIQAKPLPEIQPIPQQAETQLPSVAPADTATATLAAAEASVLAAPDLTGFAPTLGQANAPPSPEQVWLAQIVARLRRYQSYPRSAVKRHQEDTVMLQFSVNPAGQVVYSKIDSKLHYKALENEVRKMLRLAAPLPAPPPQLLVEQPVVNVPVNFHLIAAKQPSAVTHCVEPADPGTVPSGAVATLAQMQTYRQHLDRYLAAARSELDCLGGGAGQAGPAARSAAIDRVHALVDDFNAQARAFQAEAVAEEAMQAQQARQAAAARLAQAQAAAARVYAACTSPSAHRPSAAATLTADTVQSYRKQLVGYQVSVAAYLACINRVHVASAAQTGSALTAVQRAELDRTAVQLANAAVLPFDQLVVGFNAQLQRLQVRAGATRARELKEQAALARAILPNSVWDTPAPLPRDECIRITRSGQTYQAQLCRSSYFTQVSVDTDHVLPGTIVDIGKVRAPMHGPQTTSYSVSYLEVTGSHVVLTIGRISGAAAGVRENWDSVHFDLMLSQDGQSLRGQCWTEQKRWDCQLPRHH